MKTCTFCIMDETDPDIVFDENGQCHHCKSYMEYVPTLSAFQADGSQILEDQIAQIKNKQSGKYDCVIGLSGGVDSTYLAYIVKKKLGLNPIAVHMDNGWNSELSVKNVENIVTKLNIDLHTKVLDWNEFSKLQLAFLKASTPDSEIPTDHAICATLYQVAKKYNVKYIISGANQVTERIMPHAWSQGHGDYRYISSIYKKYTEEKLQKFPYINSLKTFFYKKIFGIQFIHLFDYFKFDLNTAKQTIQNELDWKDYGGKHYESVYTKFFQGYILPKKFGYDKRKGHLSNLICANALSRSQALKKLKKPAILEEEIKSLKDYVAKKLAISPDDLEKILNVEPMYYKDYPNAYNTFWYRYSRKYIKPIYRYFFPVKEQYAKA
ncbi:MAG: N-acetyl sugar amidotransferase [Alphaproteobacteria bacterium]|nr:MAG: N-acetyl sugar amidotransferase [Alphaproteobacteria bacterium]